MAGYGKMLIQHCVYICIIGTRTRDAIMENYLALSPK